MHGAGDEGKKFQTAEKKSSGKTNIECARAYNSILAG
jgi:hypothetical protein